MSEETAREIAEREIGRSDDRREAPERRAHRSGDGRRRGSAAGGRRNKGPKLTENPSPKAAPEAPSTHPSGADQRQFKRN